MPRRRTLTARPLLVAAGSLLAVSCSGPKPDMRPTGNLMAPPMVTGELCVDTVPESAVVTVNGATVDPRCAPVTAYEGSSVTVSISAPGYVAQEQRLTIAEKMQLKVELMAMAPPPPVGNLMPPPEPPPPPVGNLVAPPPIERPKPQ